MGGVVGLCRETTYMTCSQYSFAKSGFTCTFVLFLGEAVDLSQYHDLNIMTGVIKLYLRELPIPLITFDTYKEIMKATGGI